MSSLTDLIREPASIGFSTLHFSRSRFTTASEEKRALYLPVTHCSDTRTQRYPHDFALYACNGSSQKSGGGKPRGRVQVKNRSRNDDQPEAGRCKSLILLVEQRGIEPLTSALRTRRSAKLSYCPTRNKILQF